MSLFIIFMRPEHSTRVVADSIEIVRKSGVMYPTLKNEEGEVVAEFEGIVGYYKVPAQFSA